MIEESYYKEIENLIKLIDTIKEIPYKAILIYGSFNNKDLFIPGQSDIDLMIMVDDINKLDLQKICNKLMQLGIDFKEKKPLIINDILCKRIEFYYNKPTIPIDITICSGLIPSKGTLIKNAWYDSFEALMGGVYISKNLLYGQIPDYDLFEREFSPFYNDELRDERLNVLAKRLESSNKRIATLYQQRDKNILDYVCKIRKFFIKFLFIFYRQYYFTPDKNIYYQLNSLLNISDYEKNALCFLNNDDLFGNVGSYLEVSNEYIKKYKKS